MTKPPEDEAPPVPVDTNTPKPKRQAGTLKGLLKVPLEFFDPLPDDELDLWEGKTPQPGGPT